MREDAGSHARRRDESQRGCGEERERRERASRRRRTHKNRFDSAVGRFRRIGPLLYIQNFPDLSTDWHPIRESIGLLNISFSRPGFTTSRRASSGPLSCLHYVVLTSHLAPVSDVCSRVFFSPFSSQVSDCRSRVQAWLNLGRPRLSTRLVLPRTRRAPPLQDPLCRRRPGDARILPLSPPAASFSWETGYEPSSSRFRRTTV